MSALLLMRHGQATFGAAVYDALSPIGRAQADATGGWIAAHRPTARIWSGPRQRHIETAAAVARASGLPAAAPGGAGLDEFAEGEEVLALGERLGARLGARLGERLGDRLGEKLGVATPPGPDAAQRRIRLYNQAIAAWAAGAASIGGRPSFSGFRANVRGWLDAATAPGARGRTELVVTSAGVIAAVVCEVLDLPDARWLELLQSLANASLTEIAFSPGRRGLRSFNAHGHLPPAQITLL